MTGYGQTIVGVGVLARITGGAHMNVGGCCIVSVQIIDPDGWCIVQIISIGKNRAGWQAKNRLRVHVAWLEGI